MTNIEFYNIPAAVAADMAADMDAAATELWSYPDDQWQLRFEAQWLRERGYIHEAEKADAAAHAGRYLRQSMAREFYRNRRGSRLDLIMRAALIDIVFACAIGAAIGALIALGF